MRMVCERLKLVVFATLKRIQKERIDLTHSETIMFFPHQIHFCKNLSHDGRMNSNLREEHDYKGDYNFLEVFCINLSAPVF